MGQSEVSTIRAHAQLCVLLYCGEIWGRVSYDGVNEWTIHARPCLEHGIKPWDVEVSGSFLPPFGNDPLKLSSDWPREA